MLATAGRQADSFIMLDLMRLPLGILSGMGFIGAGAILRRGSAIVGVTTAATLWFVTVMGLCFGAGQLDLGVAMLGVGPGRAVGAEMDRAAHRRGSHRRLAACGPRPTAPAKRRSASCLPAAGFRVASCGVGYAVGAKLHRLRYELRWRATRRDSHVPKALAELEQMPGVRRVEWAPTARRDDGQSLIRSAGRRLWGSSTGWRFGRRGGQRIRCFHCLK